MNSSKKNGIKIKFYSCKIIHLSKFQKPYFFYIHSLKENVVIFVKKKKVLFNKDLFNIIFYDKIPIKSSDENVKKSL